MVIPLCEYTKNPLNFMGCELNHNMDNKMVTEKKKGQFHMPAGVCSYCGRRNEMGSAGRAREPCL